MSERRKLERAVVLAAGTGSRLLNGSRHPKPLKPVAAIPLLVRILRTLQNEGIREAVIVVGYMGDRIRRTLLADNSLHLAMTFVVNERYTLKNGVSLLAAREHIGDDALLTMADHLYAPEIVRRLRAVDLPRGASALAVDVNIARCFDLDDATKVRVEQGRIVHIGKEIDEFNAIDTGVFRIDRALVDELAWIFERNGDCSLSDGVLSLAKKGNFYACDVGDAHWIDVDTPAALARAEAMVHLFGDDLGRELVQQPVALEPESMEIFAPALLAPAL